MLHHDVAVRNGTPERKLGPRARDLLAAALAPLTRQPAPGLVEVQRKATAVEPQEREPSRVLLHCRDFLQRHPRRERTHRSFVAMGVPGVMQEQARTLCVVTKNGGRLTRVEVLLGTIGNGLSFTING